jgi:hypothetical protein
MIAERRLRDPTAETASELRPRTPPLATLEGPRSPCSTLARHEATSIWTACRSCWRRAARRSAATANQPTQGRHLQSYSAGSTPNRRR